METFEPLPKRSRLIKVENMKVSKESHTNVTGVRIGVGRVNFRYGYPKRELRQLRKDKNKCNDKNYKPSHSYQGVLSSNRPRRSIIIKP